MSDLNKIIVHYINRKFVYTLNTMFGWPDMLFLCTFCVCSVTGQLEKNLIYCGGPHGSKKTVSMALRKFYFKLYSSPGKGVSLNFVETKSWHVTAFKGKIRQLWSVGGSYFRHKLCSVYLCYTHFFLAANSSVADPDRFYADPDPTSEITWCGSGSWIRIRIRSCSK
jgi:hypothetical protein